jgi:hypothetical protein
VKEVSGGTEGRGRDTLLLLCHILAFLHSVERIARVDGVGEKEGNKRENMLAKRGKLVKGVGVYSKPNLHVA